MEICFREDAGKSARNPEHTVHARTTTQYERSDSKGDIAAGYRSDAYTKHQRIIDPVEKWANVTPRNLRIVSKINLGQKQQNCLPKSLVIGVTFAT